MYFFKRISLLIAFSILFLSILSNGLAGVLYPEASILFADNDPDIGQIGGRISIIHAYNESALTHYVIYWGDAEQNKLSVSPIAVLSKTGRHRYYELPVNTPIPNGASSLLLYTRNNSGETFIRYVEIADIAGIPQLSPVFGHRINNLAYGKNRFIAVGDMGAIFYSSDGTNWTQAYSGITEDIYGAEFFRHMGPLRCWRKYYL